MDNQKYYRSPIDKLVIESGIAATKIAKKMGIKYHRMVALRRLKDVSDNDVALCEKAITALKQKPKSKDSTFKPIVTESVKPAPESVAFMLGQASGLISAVFDSLQVNNVPIPEQILLRKKQLEEQCNKLFSV